jgi:integrase
MGSIIERKRNDGSISYQGMVKISGGKAAVKTYDTREKAQAFVDSVEEDRSVFRDHAKRKAELLRRQLMDTTEVQRTEIFKDQFLKDVMRKFVDTDACAMKHRSNMPTILRKIGNVKIGEIKRYWVKQYIAKLRASKTNIGSVFAWATIAAHMKAMAVAIRWSADEWDVHPGHLPFSTKLFPDNWQVNRERRMEPFEERAIVSRLRRIQYPSKNHWRRLFCMALETGARLQELVLSEWTEFDLDRRVWNIPASHTKTKQARTVPLSKRATRCMRILKMIASSESTRVFHTLGEPTTVSASYHRYVLESGVVDLRFHDLRHEAISRMVLYKRQLSVFEIMKIVGHRSLEMLNRYANLRGDELAHKME